MLKFDQKYVTLDCESRSLNLSHKINIPNANQVWQISWIETQGNRILTEHDYYVDVPKLNLSDEVARLTHFDHAKYNRLKQPATKAFDALKKYLYDPQYIVIGQNILNFDWFMLDTLARQAGERIDYGRFIERTYDTRPLALAHRSGLDKPRNGDILDWQFKILNDRTLKAKTSQGVLLKFFGIEHDPDRLHDGLYDVKMTWEIFKQLRKILEL
jgi:DNA polymerase III epsilon subunit-like protein